MVITSQTPQNFQAPIPAHKASQKKRKKTLPSEISCRRNYSKKNLYKVLNRLQRLDLSIVLYDGVNINLYSQEEQKIFREIANKLETLIQNMKTQRINTYKEGRDILNAELIKRGKSFFDDDEEKED